MTYLGILDDNDNLIALESAKTFALEFIMWRSRTYECVKFSRIWLDTEFEIRDSKLKMKYRVNLWNMYHETIVIIIIIISIIIITRKNGTQRAQILQKEILKLCTTGALRLSISWNFLHGTDVKRCILDSLRPNVLSNPETLYYSSVTSERCQWHHLVVTRLANYALVPGSGSGSPIRIVIRIMSKI